MLFNSPVFLIFLALFFFGWPLMRKHPNLRWFYLVLASFVFYGWWDWRFLFLILGSGFIDFFAGLGMARYERRKKLFLILSICGNLGSLAIFKYLDFTINNANWLLHFIGWDINIPVANLILPVGISFYTFQSMSYTIDIYRGQVQPTRNLFHFFSYLAMFPQLVAGPIVRARDLLPQLRQAKPISEQQRWDGAKLIIYGYFKKVVIADTLAPTINAAFAESAPLESGYYWWVIMIMFAYQIYCDFSGYSNIARGLGKWMGYEYPVNFDHPYIASSFRDFWQRWHISLSTWFRDYVYFPLGGGRRGKRTAHINMWTTMLISGLWHGAAWHFIAWSALHSFYLSLERMTNWPAKLIKWRGGRHLATLAVFILTVIAWVFFRADNCRQALIILQNMFDFSQFNYDAADKLIDNNAVNLLLLIIGRQLLFHFHLEKSSLALSQAKWKKYLEPLVLAVMILMCIFMRGPGSSFIYFQF